MQEQQQKREHMAKVARQQQALNGYQQQPDPMAPLEHGVAASQRSSKSPQRSAPAKFKPPEEIVLPEEVTVLQLASLLSELPFRLSYWICSCSISAQNSTDTDESAQTFRQGPCSVPAQKRKAPDDSAQMYRQKLIILLMCLWCAV